jgi:drug/metabolite transporter (DMT)-like permease
MTKEKKRTKNFWLMLGLLSVVIAAPNAMIVRSITGGDSVDSLTLLIAKFAIMLLVFIVPLFRFVKRNFKVFRRAYADLLKFIITSATGTTMWFIAIEHSSASYASILSLLSPVLLVVFSARMVRDKVTRRSVVGITLAALGGILVVALPALLGGSLGSGIFPLATVLMLICTVATPLSVMYFRRVNEHGVPFTAAIGMYALVSLPILIVIYMAIHGGTVFVETFGHLPLNVLLAALYSGLVITFLARTLATKCYEYSGAAVRGGLSYLETLLNISLPLIILGEMLSIEMMLGAALILVGVFLAESGGKHHLFKLGFKWHPHHLHHHGRIR